jgi:hypothetical protein
MRAIICAAWFALGFAVAFIGTAAIDVFLLGHVERGKDANTTFLIFAWLTPVVALLMTVAYLLGAKTWSYSPSRGTSFVAGTLISLLFRALAWAGEFLPDPLAISLTWLMCLGGSFFAARIIRGPNAV